MTFIFTFLLFFSTLFTNPTPCLGFSVGWQRGEVWKDQSLQMLPTNCWMNWLYKNIDEPGYFPLIWQMGVWDEVAAEEARTHGGIWMMGNEPELAANNISPFVAANFSQKWEREVGGSWAPAGTITWEGGYAWLDKYLAANGRVGTHWQIHIYDTYTADQWEEKWDGFKAWMQKNDVVRPVIVSETAGWGPSFDQRLIMRRIRHIQAHDPLLVTVLWYSDEDYWGVWPWADLRRGGDLTPLGIEFNGKAMQEPVLTPTPEPEPTPVPTPTPTPVPTALDFVDEPWVVRLYAPWVGK